MSQVISLGNGGGSGGAVLTLTGNTGGPIAPLAGNINVVGDGVNITVDGIALDHTLTISVSGVLAQNFVTNDGVAIPVANSINILDSEGTALFHGSGNTITHTYTDISNNTAIGLNTLPGNPFTGSNCCAFGTNALGSVVLGTTNINNAFGVNSLASLNGGHNNCAFGDGGDSLVNGDYNTFLGNLAGDAYTGSESSNICIGYNADGVVGESNVLRIGNATGNTSGELNKAFICGIEGVNVGSTAKVVTIASDQLGSATITAGSGITITPGANTITIASTTSGAVLQLTGNSGVATPTAGNINVIDSTAEGTARFTGSGSTLTQTYTDANFNTGLGLISLASITSASFTTAFGWSSLNTIASSSGSSAFGARALWHSTAAINDAFGINSLASLTTGVENSAFSGNSLSNITTGSSNCAFGQNTGINYTGAESNNILIGNSVDGVLGESNVLRIGDSTGSGSAQLNKAFICGIDGINVGSVAKVVTMASNQLGTATLTAGSGITVTPGANTITIAASGALGQTITGNSGVATFSSGNINVIDSTTQGTARFTGSGSTLTQTFTDANNNTGLGTNVFNSITGTAASNTAFGWEALTALTDGLANTAYGLGALHGLTTTNSNTAVGYAAMANAVDAYENTAIGAASLQALISGAQNAACGLGALSAITTGNQNIGLGSAAGQALTTSDSRNICINHVGVPGNNNTLRIGAATGSSDFMLNRAFICGIDGVNVGSVAKVVTMASDQLGTATLTAGTGVSIVAGANTITLNAIGGGVTWSVITANQTAAVNNGYFSNKATPLLLALPTTSAVGDTIKVININSATGTQFTQAASQQIFFSTASTTVGATGTLTSSAIGDTVTLVCRTANLVWWAETSIGNWTTA